MTTHVLIVDAVTFPIHLQHLFIGTGKKDQKLVDLKGCEIPNFHHSSENSLVHLMTDMSRVRKDDKIIFYLQQGNRKNVPAGQFFGIFAAQENFPFIDNRVDKQYLAEELKRPLTFRALIVPYKVYPRGVTEWEALDSIEHIDTPYEMQWSLIYRKLKGYRGSTMITDYESKQLQILIEKENNFRPLIVKGKTLSFCQKSLEITTLNERAPKYGGSKKQMNILPRLVYKFNKKNSFEAHLQMFIVQNIGRSSNQSLDNTLMPKNSNIEWIGNEVSCGVGMQRIDLLFSFSTDTQDIITPIELKAIVINDKNIKSILDQKQRYLDWLVQYYLPNHSGVLSPTIVSKCKAIENYNLEDSIIKSLNYFNSRNKKNCLKLKYLVFDVQDHDLVFKNIPYN